MTLLSPQAGLCNEIIPHEASSTQAITILVTDSRRLVAYELNQPINIASSTTSLVLEQVKIPHTFKFASPERINVLMQENRPFCATHRLKTAERERLYLFSQPLNIFLSRRLYQHKSAAPLPVNLLDEQGAVKQLADVFTVLKNKLIILPRGVAYPEGLAVQIGLIAEKNIYYREGGDLFQIAVMLEKGRGDFVLEYPVDIWETYGDLAPLRSYPLGATEAFSHAHLMCNDTVETRKLLAQVNMGLSALYKDGRLLNAHLRWLPAADHQSFTQLFEKVFTK